MENIRKFALRRFLLLSLSLLTGLTVGVYEFLKGALPASGFGGVLALLITAFLAGISLILRTASRRSRRHFLATASSTDARPAEPLSVFAFLRNKPR